MNDGQVEVYAESALCAASTQLVFYESARLFLRNLNLQLTLLSLNLPCYVSKCCR